MLRSEDKMMLLRACMRARILSSESRERITLLPPPLLLLTIRAAMLIDDVAAPLFAAAHACRTSHARLPLLSPATAAFFAIRFAADICRLYADSSTSIIMIILLLPLRLFFRLIV